MQEVYLPQQKDSCVHNEVVLNFISKKSQSVKLALVTMPVAQEEQIFLFGGFSSNCYAG